MCEAPYAMKLFIDSGYKRLMWDLDGIEESILDWKIHPDANTIRWLLNHISTVLNIYIPRVTRGNLDYKPTGWNDDETPQTLKSLLAEIKHGEIQAKKELDKLTQDKLQEEIDWYIGKASRKDYLVLLVSEVLHHEGQVAALISLKERIDKIKPRVQPPE
jgi:uncharacterized damage-inducible protein DinB